jgi:hypothetical protein
VPIADTKEYGEYQLLQAILYLKINETDGTTYRVYEEKHVPFSKCNVNHTAFSYLNKEDIEAYPVELYYCPDWNNLTIQANFHSPSY